MKYLITLILSLNGALAFADKPTVEKHSGVYWVPVESTSEARYAVFGLPEIEVRKTAEKIKIVYPLPRELTGALNEIELEGEVGSAGSPLTLTGPLGSGTCPSATDLKSCEINYKNLQIDVGARSELLRQISRTPTELQLREKIAASFCVAAAGGGEPCGFLTVGY